MHNVYISGRFPIKSLIFLYHIYLENTTGSKFSHNFLHLNFFLCRIHFWRRSKYFCPVYLSESEIYYEHEILQNQMENKY